MIAMTGARYSRFKPNVMLNALSREKAQTNIAVVLRQRIPPSVAHYVWTTTMCYALGAHNVVKGFLFTVEQENYNEQKSATNYDIGVSQTIRARLIPSSR